MAVTRHNLPASTKTYDNPEALAQDPDVDLIVCCVRVDRHYELMRPAVKAGKNAFVEWPLASNLQQAEELLTIAQQTGSKTVVGLQARPSPYIQKIKSLVANKTIGDLLSVNINFDVGFPGDVEAPGIDYMAKKASGASYLTILFGHTADPIFHALGGLEEVSARLTTRWAKTQLLHSDGSFNKWIARETPDHVMMHGTVKENSAPISIALRNGKAFKDTPNMRVSIFGSKGEIRFTAVMPTNIATGTEKLELYDHETDTVEVVDVEYAPEVRDLPGLAKNIGKLYELFAEGGAKSEGFVDFEEAVGMHKVIAAIERSSETGKVEKV